MNITDLKERALLITAALADMRNREFKYGDFDCHIFAADIVRMYTLKDYAASFRGTYKDEKSAYRIVTSHGGPIDFVTALLGVTTRPVFHARIGDVMALKIEERKIAIGVCLGSRAVFLNPKGGFEFRELSDCLCSWEIE